VTTRDYDTLAVERPTTSGPQVSRDAMGRRAVTVQLWDWSADASTYALTHVQSVESAADRWATTARRTVYRAWSRAELTDLAAAGGFATSRWLTPQASGWYQPVLLARA
jgi:glycine/sarcosine N-methyltransferase